MIDSFQSVERQRRRLSKARLRGQDSSIVWRVRALNSVWNPKARRRMLSSSHLYLIGSLPIAHTHFLRTSIGFSELFGHYNPSIVARVLGVTQTALDRSNVGDLCYAVSVQALKAQVLITIGLGIGVAGAILHLAEIILGLNQRSDGKNAKKQGNNLHLESALGALSIQIVYYGMVG